MVITKDTQLPTIEDLTMTEVNLSSGYLMASAPYLGKFCERANNEFMLCRMETNDPRRCVDMGKIVTRCTLHFFSLVKETCLHEFNQYANCVDKSSGDYATWPCRKTHSAFRECIEFKMTPLKYPGFGYFTRGRVHKTRCVKPPEPKPPIEYEGTPRLPDDKPRPEARFGGRSYYYPE